MPALALAFVLGFLALGIRTFLFQPFDVPGASMIPTFNIGDNFWAEKFTYRDRHPDRGDVIVWRSSRLQTSFVKRVIGLPGDHVQLKGGRVLLNGQLLPQHRIADFIDSCEQGPCAVAQYEERYPNGRIGHVLDRDPYSPGDNTDIYIVPADHYFVLGDNRDNSADSRDSLLNLGFIPQREIVGRAVRKYVANGSLTWKPIE